MDASILTVILSGQLLLVAWQIYKEIVDRKAKKKEKKDGLHEMLFSLYRDNLRQRIIALDKKLDSTKKEDIRVESMELKEDMKVYLKNNGNGLIKQLYIHLADKARAVRGEDAYALLWIDNIDKHSPTP